MACMQLRKSHMLMMSPLRTVHGAMYSGTGLRPVHPLPTMRAYVCHQVLQQRERIRGARRF